MDGKQQGAAKPSDAKASDAEQDGTANEDEQPGGDNRDGMQDRMWLIEYESHGEFDAEVRAVRFLEVPHVLMDTAEDNPLFWRRRGSGWEAPAGATPGRASDAADEVITMQEVLEAQRELDREDGGGKHQSYQQRLRTCVHMS